MNMDWTGSPDGAAPQDAVIKISELPQASRVNIEDDLIVNQREPGKQITKKASLSQVFGGTVTAAKDSADRAEKAAERAESASEVAVTAGNIYTFDQAQEAINAGTIKNGEFFFIWSPDTDPLSVAEKHKNNGGTIEATGVKISSEEFIKKVYASSLNNAESIVKTDARTRSVKQYKSENWHFVMEAEDGPSNTLMAIDNDGGLWLAGLLRGIQEYIDQLIPKSLANRFSGYQHVVVDKTGKLSLFAIKDNGDLQIAGIDDAVQDRLETVCSTSFSRKVSGFQAVIMSKDMKTAIFAIDNDGGVHIPGVEGPLQDNMGESLASIKTKDGIPAVAWGDDIIWSERPALTAQKLTESGVVFSYIPGGEAKSGSGVMYVPSIREMPVEAREIHGGGSSGQSLNTPFDGTNANIVNRDPAYRGRLLAGANGRPEGGGLNPVSPADLKNLNDMQYPVYRQGNILPMYNKLLASGKVSEDVVFIHSPFAAGGRSFAQISKGTVPYKNGVDFVKFSVEVAAGVGKPYVFKFLTFEHGETDNDNGSSKAAGDYLAQMTPYFEGLQADFKGETGQSSDFLEVIGQVGSRINTKNQPVDSEGNPVGSPVVVQDFSVSAVDQLSYVRKNPAKAIMYGPKYPLNWLYSDGSLSHLNAQGKVLQGEYASQAIEWQLYDTAKAGTWTGTKAKSLTVSGNVITVKFDVPYAPLVIDNSIIDQADKGFGLQNKSADVTGVVVEGTDTVKITLSAAPSEDDFLLIGFSNRTPHTNGSVYPVVSLRDSSPNKSKWVSKSGQPVPLYNWAMLDRLPLKGGF